MTTLYGIKNCDTMKKAMNWLEDQNIAYEFHDYKKHGIDEAALKQAIDEHGWDTAINTRGITWKRLDENIKNGMNASKAIDLAIEKSSVVKRPLLIHAKKSYLGFKPEMYAEIFSK